MNTPKPEPPGDEKGGAKPPGGTPPGAPGGVESGGTSTGATAGKDLPKNGEGGGTPKPAVAGGPTPTTGEAAAGKEPPKGGEGGGVPKPMVAGGPTTGGTGSTGPSAAGPTPKVVHAGTPPKPGERKPVFVLPSTRKRDLLLTIVAVVVVVFFIAMGVHKMATEKPENLLEGVIVEKTVAEPLYGVSTKGVNEVDTGYHLRVQVGDRFYLLATLSQQEWTNYKVGDHIRFMKPISEQK